MNNTVEPIYPSTSANTSYSFVLVSKTHLNRPSLIPEVQLLRKWTCVWGVPLKLQLGESRIFQRAKLLFLLREKIRAFLQKLKIFGGRVLVNEFQFLITIFETFCWSDDIKVFCSFKFFIYVIISFWISLSRLCQSWHYCTYCLW